VSAKSAWRQQLTLFTLFCIIIGIIILVIDALCNVCKGTANLGPNPVLMIAIYGNITDTISLLGAMAQKESVSFFR
jgi:hypothetical protein